MGRPRCAVCYSLTSTRCSRCKAVRYCSGKCQIIHWRQGHKDNCFPPQFDDLGNDQVLSMNVGGQCAVSVPVSGGPTSPELNWASEVFSIHDSLEERPDTSGSESTSHTFTVSSTSTPLSSSSSFLGMRETYTTASVYEALPSNDSTDHEENMSSSSFPDNQEQPIVDCETNGMEFSSSEDCCEGISVNSDACSNCLTRKVSDVTQKAEYTADERNGSSLVAGIESLGHASSNCQYGINVSSMGCAVDSGFVDNEIIQKDGIRQSADSVDVQNVACKTVTEKSREAGERVKVGERLKVISDNDRDKKIQDSKIFYAASCLPYGSHSVSSDLYKNGDKPPVVPMNSSERKSVDGIHDLKTSINVVQQCKFYKISSQCVSGFVDTTDKQNDQLQLSYELFIKLFNCDKVELNPCGLFNCGNSCYANVVLQCLVFTRPLTAYLLQRIHTKSCPNSGWCFMCEFETLLQKMKLSKSSLSPAGILSHVHNIGSTLGRGREEDAHEFLRCAIDAMQSICLKEERNNKVQSLSEETTPIRLIFGGYLRSKIKCMTCHGRSERHERMMDLTVEIHGDICSLEEALSCFTTTEVLDGENKYHCSRCKSYERAKKKMTVLEAPNVLTIALKRFQSGKVGKINKTVKFPEYLNFAPYMSRTDDKSPVYRLYAVVEHIDVMNTTFTGHYVCYVKSASGKWHKIDDSQVKPVELETVLSREAYMLFYARCLPRAPRLLRKVRKDGFVGVSNTGVSIRRERGNPTATSPRPEQCDPSFSGRFYPSGVDSSGSDSSSLFSYSDEGSWSTESARGSTSTEEYSDYIFDGSGRISNWNSPYQLSEDRDDFVISPSFFNRPPGGAASTSNSGYSAGHHGHFEYIINCGGETMEAAFCPSEPSKVSIRNTTEQCSNSSISKEANWVNSVEDKRCSLRSCSSRTVQTFY